MACSGSRTLSAVTCSVRTAVNMARRNSIFKTGPLYLRDSPCRLKIWMSHGDHVRALPAGFHVTGTTGSSLSAAENREKRIFAVQFHPEVLHTERGTEILRNFVFNVCKARPEWSGSSFIASTVEEIREKIGDEQAICALSGGVMDFGRCSCSGSSRHWRPPDQYFLWTTDCCAKTSSSKRWSSYRSAFDLRASSAWMPRISFWRS